MRIDTERGEKVRDRGEVRVREGERQIETERDSEQTNRVTGQRDSLCTLLGLRFSSGSLFNVTIG